MKILVVDDDVISRRLIVRGLGKAGYETLEAEDAEAAMNLLSSGQPIVLATLDLALPDMNGLDLLAHIRSTPHLERLPVLICTVNSSKEARQAASTFVISGFLCKPISTADLREKVEEILEGEPPPLANVRRTLERLDLEVNVYLDMLDQWVKSILQVLTEMEERLGSTAHPNPVPRISALLGAAQNLGAERLCRVLEQQTTACTKGEIETTKSLMVEVLRETNVLQAEITFLRKENEEANISRKLGSSFVRGYRRALALNRVLLPSSSGGRSLLSANAHSAPEPFYVIETSPRIGHPLAAAKASGISPAASQEAPK